MDVFKINKTDFFSDATDGNSLIEGWTSMIWTERHKELGDFQMRTPYVSETISKIPLGSLISIRGSDEVCRVENLSTTRNDKGATELLVTGRSLEAILEKRVLTGPWNEPWETPGSYTAQDALIMYLWNSIGNPFVWEILRDYYWTHHVRDYIPNLAISDSTKALKAVVGAGSPDDLQTVKEWMWDRGPLYPKVQEILTLGNLGLRVVRPKAVAGEFGSPDAANIRMVTDIATVIPDDWSSARTITKTAVTSTNNLLFDVYNGRNRTVDSATETPLDVNEPVIFDYVSGHIDNPSYLFSIKEKANCIHLQAPDQSIEVYDTSITGLDHLMEWQSIDNIDDSLSGASYTQFLIDKAQSEWRRKRELRMIDGAISSGNPWVYGEDYYLGDLVTVQGEYGAGGKKMVSEYIRTSDQSGDRSYPTLIDP